MCGGVAVCAGGAACESVGEGGVAAALSGGAIGGVALGAPAPGAEVETPSLISPATAAAGPPDGELTVERRGVGAEDDVRKGMTTAGSSGRASA